VERVYNKDKQDFVFPEGGLGMEKGRQGGFTLIELMVVVIIIGLLAAFVAPKIFHRVGESRITAARNQMAALEDALDMFYVDTGRYPSSEQGMAVLNTKPEDINHWKGPYLKKRVPKDPWGNEYVYKSPGGEGRDYDIICYGADGQEGGEGDNADINSWE